jgi:phasin
MNAPFNFSNDEMLKAAKSFQVPDQVRVIAEEGVAQSRKAYAQFASLTEQNTKATQDVIATAQEGAKTIGTKLFANVSTNTEAALKAASEIAKAKSVPDALRLQAEFMKAQFAAFGAQTQELFQLSAGMSKATVEQLNTAAANTADKVKKAAA